MADLTHDQLLSALELRYDTASARVVLADLLASTGLRARASYSAEDVDRLSTALERADRRAHRAVAALRHNLSWQTVEAPTELPAPAVMIPSSEPEEMVEVAPTSPDDPAHPDHPFPSPEPEPEIPVPSPEPEPEIPVPSPEPEPEIPTEPEPAPDVPFPAPEPAPDEPAPSPPGIRFAVRGAPVRPGYTVFLCGDHGRVGAWEPAQAVALEPTGEDVFGARVDLEPGTALEFKFGVRAPEGAVAWQPGRNHVVVVPPEGALDFEVSWKS